MNNSILLNLILVIIPILFLFDKRAHLLKDWKATIAAVGVTGNLAYLLKMGLARFQVVTYGTEITATAANAAMPLASVLFCFTLPFFALALYRYLNVVFPKNELEKYSLAFSNILMGLCVAVIFFAYTKAYPVITFSLLLIFLLFVEYKNKYRFSYRFYRAFGALILLYAAAQLLFKSEYAVVYKAKSTVELNLLGVPFENYFLIGIVLLLVVYLFELFRSRHDVA